MRSLIVALLFLSAWFASAQDDAAQQAQMAAQQAMQAAQQANDQAMQAAQQANDQAMQAAQQANQMAAQTNDCCTVAIAAKPRFSLKAGAYPAGTTIRLEDRTRGAVIYYTTDGWTPTTSSPRYVGPIVLSSTTTLQAIAVAPGCARSLIASIVYTIPGTPATPPVVPPLAVLSRGMPLTLTFTSAVSSKGLQVGDKLPVALAQDLVVGNVIVAPKSTPVLTTVMQADNRGLAGAPGSVTFAVHSITLSNGETIPLSGTETKEGQPRVNTARSLFFIPLAGVGGIFIHGEEAQIQQGATFTAFVDTAGPNLTAKAVQ